MPGVAAGSLVQRLRKIRDAGVIDGRLVEWADDLRVLGNVGAHYTTERVTREDAEDALALKRNSMNWV